MAWYKSQWLSLHYLLDQIYNRYGYYTESVLSFTYEGASGKHKMAEIMRTFRSMEVGGLFAGNKITTKVDLMHGGPDGLPPSDVIILGFASGDKMVIRPSGTEPKIKYYLFFHAEGADRDSFSGVLQEKIARIKSEL